MTTIKVIISVIGGVLGHFLGGFDMLLMTLITFTIMDYLTGIMKAIANHEVSSEVGFRGIFKKILVFFVVGIAVSLDNVFGATDLRYLAIVFYIVNEGISIIENAVELGLPIPEQIKTVLNNLNKKDTEE